MFLGWKSNKLVQLKMLLFSLLLFTRVKVLCPLKSNDTNKKMHALIPKNEVASFALALKSIQVEKLYQDLSLLCYRIH